jgi:hypothetical protein
MIIHIPVNELKPPWCDEPSTLDYVYNCGIDYATNTIEALDKLNDYAETVLYCFNDVDMKLLNRWVNHQVSVGSGGILITTTSTRKDV